MGLMIRYQVLSYLTYHTNSILCSLVLFVIISHPIGYDLNKIEYDWLGLKIILSWRARLPVLTLFSKDSIYI